MALHRLLPAFVTLLLAAALRICAFEEYATIREEQPVGTYVYQVSAHGVGSSDGLIFYLLTHRNYFRVDEKNGQIFTKRIIDLEKPETCIDNTLCCPNSHRTKCIFRLSVSVRGADGRSSFTEIGVTVEDVNDNSPRFPVTSVSLSFAEGPENFGKRRGLPLATDADYALENRRITYSLEPQNNSHFSVDVDRSPEGVQAVYLKLGVPLNAETRTHYSLFLVAKDGDRQGRLAINVTVIDLNEFTPVFQKDKPTEFDVSEAEAPGYIITTVSAKDNDAPPNNRITYRLLPSSPAYLKALIAVNPYNGTISLRERLDYEKRKSFKFDVEALDAGGGNEQKSAQISIHIIVKDWNDNAPKITQDRQVVSVLEEQSKFVPLTNLMVVDPDTGPGGRVTCETTTYSNLFGCRMSTGPSSTGSSRFVLESLARLDREQKSSYNVTVNCADNGRPVLSTQHTIHVIVEDMNDHSPQFAKSLYTFWVWENKPKGTALIPSDPSASPKIEVNDPDEVGKLRLYLEDSEINRPVYSTARLFHVQQDGTIVTTEPLDAEMHTMYNFKIKATDGQHSSAAEVSVEVKDVNDHPPRFSQDEYVIQIAENDPNHGEIIRFNVHDQDVANRGFNFRLRSPENIAQHYFRMKDNRLMLIQALDREKVAHLTFFVIAEDSQPEGRRNFTSSAKVFVTVLDRNDNKPRFIVPNATANFFNVSYHEPVGAQILRLYAHDPDEGDNGTVAYKKVFTKPYKANDMFCIDAQDFLMVCSDLLYKFRNRRIHVTIKAQDRGPNKLEETQKLIINLIDIPPMYRRQTVERRNLLILILGASALFLLMLLIGWGIHYYRTRDTRRRIMHPSRHKVNYPEEQALGSLRRYSLDLNNELIYHSSKKKLLSVERASNADERLSHDSGRGCSIDQDNGSVRKLISEPRCASIMSRSRQTPPILTSMAAPLSATTPRSASALAKLPNFSTPPVQRRNITEGADTMTVVSETLPTRIDMPRKNTICTTEVWAGNSPNGSTCGTGIKNPQLLWKRNVSTPCGTVGQSYPPPHRV